MDSLFIYLIKSSLSLIILYLSYELFFKKEAYFRFSRYFLISSVFLVILLPLLPYNAIQIITFTSVPLSQISFFSNIPQFTLDEVVIHAGIQEKQFLSEVSIGMVLLWIYLSGFTFKAFQFGFRLYQIQSKIHKSKTFESENLQFVIAEKGSPTYSFLKWIFIDPELFNRESEFTAIVAHEKIHLDDGHTYDLILAEILTAIQWFNPFVYLLKKNIKENHEYITDREVITNYQNIAEYQLLLLEHSSILKTNILTHNFSYSLLKRRLKIMKKTKNKLAFSSRILLLAGSFMLIFFACSSPEEKAKKVAAEENTNKVEEASSTVDNLTVFQVVEKMPEFAGGIDAMYKYISDNITYPEAAKKAGTQGRVVIGFIIEKDGKITTLEVKKGIGDGCDEEAVRVIQNMPNWTPGQQRGENVRVAYNLPIKFSLQ